MYIKIDLKQKKINLPPIKFQIVLDELENAIEDCYMDLGTPYNPIAIDNFVDIGKNAFSIIDQKTKISISLEKDTGENLSKIIDPKLVCCKVKNVGKSFINQDSLVNNHWKKIFKYKKGLVYSAPDGTLYISPKNNGKCVISTKKTKTVYKDNVSYSILISLKMKTNNEMNRRFYLILDPLVKISSQGGTNAEKI